MPSAENRTAQTSCESYVCVSALGAGYHLDAGGLYLQVTGANARSWIFRYQRNGRRREMGLGPLHLVGLEEARRKAHRCRQMLFDGTDPLEQRRNVASAARLEAARAVNFQQCAEEYITAHQAGWRNPKSAAQWSASLRDHVYPVIGGLPVQAVDTALVMRVLTSIWTKVPETASRVRGRVESILGYATTAGYRTGDNPARWNGHLENLLPARAKVARIEHHAALPYAEIAAFMTQLRRQDGTGARALEFLILTATRTGEVIGARWGEIDLAERLWTIPADRMKAGAEHRVPLSGAAMGILKEMADVRSGDFVFPGRAPGQPLGATIMSQQVQRLGRRDLTVHGFRSTFRDWAAERTAFPAEIAEMALAHAVGDKTERAYRRGDMFEKRRQLGEAWARFCATPAGEGATVVAIGAAV